MRLDERTPNLVLELKSDDIYPSFWPKMVENWQNTPFCQFSTVFGKVRSNAIRFEFSDQIWNPVIKAHILNPKMKEG